MVSETGGLVHHYRYYYCTKHSIIAGMRTFARGIILPLFTVWHFLICKWQHTSIFFITIFGPKLPGVSSRSNNGIAFHYCMHLHTCKDWLRHHSVTHTQHTTVLRLCGFMKDDTSSIAILCMHYSFQTFLCLIAFCQFFNKRICYVMLCSFLYYGDNFVLGTLPSVLWLCWLGGRKGVWPV